MGKLPWFKHYNNAMEGQFIGDLIAEKKYDAVTLVFAIMELISRYEDLNNRGFASVPIERIARLVNMKPSRIDRLLTQISLVSRSDLKCEIDEKQPRNRVFLMRNWLKLQETRGGKRLTKVEQNSGRSKKLEVRSKKEEEKKNIAPSVFSKPLEAAFSDLILVFQERKVTPKLLEGWVKAFPDEQWIKQEIFKAISWEDSNPQRKKKNFGAFITRWLTKGWDTRTVRNNYTNIMEMKLDD